MSGYINRTWPEHRPQQQSGRQRNPMQYISHPITEGKRRVTDISIKTVDKQSVATFSFVTNKYLVL